MFDYVPVLIFLVAVIAIMFEFVDKSLITLGASGLMIFFGILSPQEAISAVDFDTILLLMGMMLLVNVASKSGIFQWITVRILSLTKGNPLLIFIFFSLLTGVISSFLNNVTTVLLIVPLTIQLLQGMGRDPRIYVFAEVIFTNIGGDLTLIGDASNTIIGGAGNLSFMDFISNMWVPVSFVSAAVLGLMVAFNWKKIKPVSKNLVELFTVNFLIRKIKHEFVKITFHRDFVMKVLLVFLTTLIGFFLTDYLQMPSFVIAFSGAILLSVITHKRVPIHESFSSLEWNTLFFFTGIFILVAGVEKSGFLDLISHAITNSTSDLLYLTIIIVWATGLISSFFDNIPFVTVMVPVILSMQAQLGGGPETQVLWWALSMGACLGGSGTIIGASSTIVGMDLLAKGGYKVSFFDYMKVGMPITLVMMTISSIYLIFRLS